jgi:glucokinase
MRSDPSPVRLVADVGGTRARFARIGTSPRDLEQVEDLECADYDRIEDAIAAYLARYPHDVEELCMAVAGPVDQDLVDLPNNPWTFSRHELEASLGASLLVINDFTAQALSIDLLVPDELEWLGAPRPRGPGIRAILGPGTGLGVAVQTTSGEIIPSEGGHVGFAPTGEHEIDLLRALTPRFRRLSVERLVSGPGLEHLYWANRQLADVAPEARRESRSAPEIADLAAEGDALALRSVEDLLDILASFAGDIALVAWATGGVYLSGGVLAKLMPFLDVERFRDRFEDKGRFTRFCETVPIARIRAEQPGLLGCSAALEARRRTVAAARAGH